MFNLDGTEKMGGTPQDLFETTQNNTVQQAPNNPNAPAEMLSAGALANGDTSTGQTFASTIFDKNQEINDLTGQLEANPLKKEYQAPAGASVSQRLLDLLDKDNPFITRAKTSAAQAANARGLQNTSMGVQAGEAAAIDAALPIAQGDAANFTNLFGSDQAAKQQAELYRVQGDVSKGLNEQQAGFDMAKQEAQNVWENKFLQDKIALEKLGLGLDQKQQVISGFNTIQGDFQKDWMEILLNPNFETDGDRQKALNDLVASTQSRIQILSSTYEVPLEWAAPEKVETGVMTPEEKAEAAKERWPFNTRNTGIER